MLSAIPIFSVLFFSNSRSFLLHFSLLLSHTLTHLAQTIISFLRLFNWAAISLWHSFLPGNNTADELARRGALLQQSTLLRGLSPHSSCIRSSLALKAYFVIKIVQHTSTLSIYSTEKRVLPRQARCVLSCLRCYGCSLLFTSSLSRIGRVENR